MNNKLIILDRDGVINFDSPSYIKKPEEWHPIPGSIEAIARIKAKGWKVVIATNQSAVGRGIIQLTDLFGIHAKLLACVRQFGADIDGIFFCPHCPSQECACRKPKPGMFIDAQKDLNLDLSKIYFIGDDLRDGQAADLAGCKFRLLRSNEQLKNVIEKFITKKII